MLPLFSFHCCPNLPAAQGKVCAMAVAGWASCYPIKPQSSISNLQCGRALSNAMTSEITKVKQLNSFIYFFIFSPFLVSIFFFFFLSLGKRREASQFVLQFISTGLPLWATGHPSKLMQFFCKELLKSGWKRDSKRSAGPWPSLRRELTVCNKSEVCVLLDCLKPLAGLIPHSPLASIPASLIIIFLSSNLDFPCCDLSFLTCLPRV